MRTNPTLRTIQNLKSLILILCVFMGNSIKAQLNGNYTIGGASGANNYATWSAFATAYNTNGVSGKVTVTVLSNQRITSAVQLTQHASSPTTATKPLIINGNGYKITGNFLYEMIYFNGIDYCTLKNLTIIDSSANKAIGIRLTNNSNDNLIDSCTIIFAGLASTGSADNCAYLALTASNTNLSSLAAQINCSRSVFSNNIFKTSNTNSPGPMFGILEFQAASYTTTAINNSYQNNAISNYYSVGISINYTNGVIIQGNKISRNDATSLSPMDTLTNAAIRVSRTYESTRLSFVSQNIIENIPFKGATGSKPGNYLFKFFGIQLNYVNNGFFNSKRYNLECHENVIQKINAKNVFNGIYPSFCVNLKIRKNIILNNYSYQNASPIYCAYNLGLTEVTENHVKTNNFNSLNGNTVFICFTANSQTLNDSSFAANNLLDSNTIGSASCGFLLSSERSSILRNAILNNTFQTGTKDFYGIKCSNSSIKINSNLILNKGGCGNFYAIHQTNPNNNSTEITQNTIYFNAIDTTNFWGIYVTNDANKIQGNIIQANGTNSGYFITLINPAKATPVNNNMYFGKFTNSYWQLFTNKYNTFKQWQSTTLAGNNERFENPKFTNPNSLNFIPLNSYCQNIMAPIKYATFDIYNNARNKNLSDMGAIESSIDCKAIGYKFNVPSNACAGTQYGPLTIYGKSNFNDTINQLSVAFNVNNANEINEIITRKIKPYDTFSYTFNNYPKLISTGKNTIKVYIHQNDDTLSNDTVSLNVVTIKSPGGSTVSLLDSIVNKNKTILKNNTIITYNGLETFFTITPPRNLSNSDYGISNKWFANAAVYSTSNKIISSTVNINPPTTSSNLIIGVNVKDSAFQDSTISLKIKIANTITGCDTLYQFQLKLLKLPDLKINHGNKVFCSGDTISFDHNGINYPEQLNYHWNFGTNNSADTSADLFTKFIYKNGGTFIVSLTAFLPNIPFQFSSFDTITVNTKPIVKFTKDNVCPSEPLKIKNLTVPSNSNMYWDFNDGKGYIQKQDSSFMLTIKNAGTYVFRLKANNNGCIVTASQNVNIFDAPTATFSKLSGNCNNESITYQNNSTIKSGNLYFKWELGENSTLSFAKNPSINYSSSVYKNVKLTVRSDFGCAYSSTKSIYIKPAPVANFTSTDFCFIRPTEFTNTTPKIPGSKPTFLWDFGGGDLSYTENVTQSWNSVGLKTVTFKITLDNGCSDTVKRYFYVLEESTPKFNFTSKCSGDTTLFNNNSTNSKGTPMIYKWYFGDGDSSEKTNPIHIYKNRFNTTYNVKLISQIIDGCATSITKPVIINGLPNTCDFLGNADYAFAFYGVKLNPLDDNGLVGGSNGIDYTWTVNQKDTQFSKDVNAIVNYNFKKDTFYLASMFATDRNTGCKCSKEKLVTMNRATVQNLNQVQISISPNPSTGLFNLKLNKSNSNLTVYITNANGQKIPSRLIQIDDSNYQLDLKEESNGVYFMKITGTNFSKFEKITKY